MIERIPKEEKSEMRLGEFLTDFTEKLSKGSKPEDGCVLCGRKQVVLHPVEGAWACSECHTPERTSHLSECLTVLCPGESECTCDDWGPH